MTDLLLACHALLLRLAGRLPDALIAEARHRLAASDLEELAASLAVAMVERGVPSSSEDTELITRLLPGAEPALISELRRHAVGPRDPAWVFAPVSLAVLRANRDRVGRCLDLTDPRDLLPAALDDRDAAIIALANTDSETLGLWRAWRFPKSGPPMAKRVYLIEVAAGIDPRLLTLRAQVALASRGEEDPQVEVYTTGSPLPAYQRAARARSALLWASTAPYEFHRAKVYDAVDGTQRFAPDHPLITDAQRRDRIAAYLRSGTVVRDNPILRDDVVAPSRHEVVPWNFRTDGTWIWSDAVAYYLREHALAPESALLTHIEATGTNQPPLDTVTQFRARATLYRPA